MSEELTSKEISVIEKKLKQQELTEITYKYILDQKPPKSIIRRNDYGKFDYLPITAVERLLDGLFKSWKAEILREGSVVNGFYIVVRLSAEIPNSDKILVADGIGFAEFQTTKGASPTDFTKLMPGAGVMAVPKAKSEAIKNAAKSFGDLFGRNLLRNDDQSEAEYNVVSLSRTKIANTLGATDEKD